MACRVCCNRARIFTHWCRSRNKLRRSRCSVDGIQISENDSSSAVIPRSRLHLDDHTFAGGSRPHGSWQDDLPDTQCLTLLAIPKTTASPRWLRCPPPPDLAASHKTPVRHSLHASIPSRLTRRFHCPSWLCFVALHGDRSLQFSSRPPSSRAFWLDTEKSTRSAVRPTSL